MHPRAGAPPERASLARDDSGAIMVIGVFMAMLVTGFLYYIIGLGNTVIFRERMQDAADAISFSAAVTHARGMNLIALINIVMAILMAIYFTIWLVETMLILAAIACAFIPPCWPVEGVIADLIDEFDNVRTTYKNDIMDPADRIGHTAQEAIKYAWPALAQGQVVYSILSGAYRPPVTSGFVAPAPLRPLPVKGVGRSHTCDHAGLMIGEMVTWPLGFIGHAVADVIARFLGEALSWLYCPDDDVNMGPHEIDPGNGDCSDGMPGQDCEYVQIRGVTIGDPPLSQGERGAAIANWGHLTGGGAYSALGNLARFAFAQSEYYYEGDDDRDEWAWHMYWRARMRRFTMPTNILGIDLGGAGGMLNGLIMH